MPVLVTHSSLHLHVPNIFIIQCINCKDMRYNQLNQGLCDIVEIINCDFI